MEPEERRDREEEEETREEIRISLDGADTLGEEQRQVFGQTLIQLDCAKKRIAYLEGRLDATTSVFWMVIMAVAFLYVLQRIYD